MTPNLDHVIWAYHKKFSLTANYPIGHGEIVKNYPDEFLLHAERATSSQHDLICMGSDAIYMNRPLNVEFLDERLHMNGDTNLLQKNLFIILASKEMIAVSQFFSIIHVSVVISFRWLSGNTHKLSEYNWGARSMG